MSPLKPPGPGRLAVSTVPFADPRVQRLVDEVQAHYVVIYGGPDRSPVDPTEFEPPRGLFALGTIDGQDVAMGGWRHRPDLTELFGGALVAEIKRMYVAPPGRRQGHARRILTFLEDTAREAGAEVLVLETGLMQPDAIALYEASGYEPTVRFGHYASSDLARYFAKRLTPAPQASS
ncbi:GNAT superfamily N-acetyltransferase [Phycicoccus badiiscoriae]|uniref:GNAT superfamily N-acetyltransferase n=1 Tax=Pedococcus badiiscoriae TaxID=642776 RepID=A0A852WHZ2_9MICO|nr:GNAT family N-acetyltransferase [Pedococcus badiiscoriae]NYG08598.1 GNAT superfamily N-acetyltransferase [Pedococcus badiiscoriae]